MAWNLKWLRWSKMYIFQSCYFCSFPETLAGICGLHCEALRRRVSGYFLMLSPVVILRRAGRGFPCHDFGIPFRCVERIQRCILLAQEVSHGLCMSWMTAYWTWWPNDSPKIQRRRPNGEAFPWCRVPICLQAASIPQNEAVVYTRLGVGQAAMLQS